MTIASNLGFPRIGPRRELKRALERYWAGKCSADELLAVGRDLRRQAWRWQHRVGIEHIPSNDFSLYDHMLDTSLMVDAIPERFRSAEPGLATYFAMARGVQAGHGTGCGCGNGQASAALEMTKWFDTNYHYLVPELEPGQTFSLGSTKPVDEFLEAKALAIETRPVLVGPVTYLRLAKSRTAGFRPLELLDGLLEVYEEVLRRLADAGAEWVQLDEPSLVVDLDDAEREALARAYRRLADAAPLKLLVAAYFGELRDNLATAVALPVHALHVDMVRGRGELDAILKALPADKLLSIGVVNGRNVWRTDFRDALSVIERAVDRLGLDQVMIAPSCSLLHSPVDLESETQLDGELRSWLAFARQKLLEVSVLAATIDSGIEPTPEGETSPSMVQEALAENARAVAARRASPRTRNPAVRQRVAAVDEAMLRRRSEYPARREAQRKAVPLPLLPTTTIGSFPQTPEIRRARAAFKRGELSREAYDEFLRGQITEVVRFQEECGIDVLVHGEAERNDMVEYFGEELEGIAVTSGGWVQSYGSRCVKPPIIYGDVTRPGPMTVGWIEHAMRQTDKPVKGMLTGPVTILCWSFVRDDQPRSDTCRQLALAIRDEVVDLEAAGVGMIQIDEPAFREGLPLRRDQWADYFRWAVDCFRLSAAGVADATQIHTHMCYAEFNSIIDSIAAMDADVISIETSRSNMELLDAFVRFKYPNEIGPGVYDIHSPRVPDTESMVALLHKALEVLRPEQIWVNPDCGLKTRRWEEITPALENMVAAAREVRSQAPSRSTV
ncbi:MAG: 5-methyltetrahydropteroyltriglutamate--homocysteine S-methyltransferase [Thermoguttaceae bacterium]